MEQYVQVIGLIIVALINLYGIYLTNMRLLGVKNVVDKTELNTNNMKDALVQATAEAAHAAGMHDQKVAAALKLADVVDATPNKIVVVPIPVPAAQLAKPTSDAQLSPLPTKEGIKHV